MPNPTQKINNIPVSLAQLFQEYDFESLDIDLYANTIIERILERGTWEELHWLFQQYGVAQNYRIPKTARRSTAIKSDI